MSYGPGEPPDDFPIPDPNREAEDDIKVAQAYLNELKREFEEIGIEHAAAEYEGVEDEAVLNEIKGRGEAKQNQIDVQDARILELEKTQDGTQPPTD